MFLNVPRQWLESCGAGTSLEPSDSQGDRIFGSEGLEGASWKFGDSGAQSKDEMQVRILDWSIVQLKYFEFNQPLSWLMRRTWNKSELKYRYNGC